MTLSLPLLMASGLLGSVMNAPIQTQRPREAVLLIGIADYNSALNAKGTDDLKGPLNDIKRIRSVLPKLGFKNPEIVELSDEQATKSGIRAALAKYVSLLKPSDKFFFYFAGHGTRQASSGNVFLLPQDAVFDKLDTHVSVEELLKWLKAIPGDKTAILDACYSGRLALAKSSGGDKTMGRYAESLPAPGSSKGPVASDEANLISYSRLWNLQNSSPVKMILACKPHQLAQEWKIDSPGIPNDVNEPTGVFTHALTRYIQAATGESISWQEVTEAVRDQIAKELGRVDVQDPIANPAALSAAIVPGSVKPRQLPITELRQLFWREAPDANFTVMPVVSGEMVPTATPIGWRLDLQVSTPSSGALAMILGDDQGFQVVYPPLSGSQHSLRSTWQMKPEKPYELEARPFLQGELKIRTYFVPGAARGDVVKFQPFLDAFTGEPFPQESSKNLSVQASLEYKTFNWSLAVVDELAYGAVLDEECSADFFVALSSARKGGGSPETKAIYRMVFEDIKAVVDGRETIVSPALAGSQREKLLDMLFGPNATPLTGLRAVINAAASAESSLYTPESMPNVRPTEAHLAALTSRDFKVRAIANYQLFNLIYKDLIKLP